MARNVIVMCEQFGTRPAMGTLAKLSLPLRRLAGYVIAAQDAAQQRYPMKELDGRLLRDVGVSAGALSRSRVKALPERIEVVRCGQLASGRRPQLVH